jgi:5-methylthioadenosine/S-adenosylhomocysteine deaminase
LYRATAAFARERNLPIAVHIAESQLESDLVAGATGDFADGLRHRGIEIVPRAASPLSLMQALGVLGTETLLIHCVRVDAEDIRLIADSDSAVAHCPVSNARLGHGIAPLRALLNANLRVGLGTDSVASSDRMDILDEARVAGLFANVREAHHAAIPTSTLLELATVGGARALGIDREVGTLEPGKWADLAAFRLDSLKAPVFDPFAAVIHALAGMRASDVVVAGRPLLRNSQLIHRDADLPNRVQATAQKLQEWLKTSLVPSPTPP